MDEIVLARHGESETATAGLVGGDAPLTDRGRAQARALGEGLGSHRFDVCLTSAARRARETALLAFAGGGVPTEVMADLGDIDFGAFDGRPLGEYRDWIAAHRPDEAPPGGESRADTLRRLCRAYRYLLARPERRVLVVAHGLTLSALADERPRPVVSGVPYGSSLALDDGELAEAVERLERWCEAPAW